jgi:hypothetical protein
VVLYFSIRLLDLADGIPIAKVIPCQLSGAGHKKRWWGVYPFWVLGKGQHMRWYGVDPFWGARDGTGGGVRSF